MKGIKKKMMATLIGLFFMFVCVFVFVIIVLGGAFYIIYKFASFIVRMVGTDLKNHNKDFKPNSNN